MFSLMSIVNNIAVYLRFACGQLSDGTWNIEGKKVDLFLTPFTNVPSFQKISIPNGLKWKAELYKFWNYRI